MSQKTPLYAAHQRQGAKIAEFAGWELPLWYPAGQSAEHHATRKACGLFDICHMGEFRIRGAGSLSFLSSLLTNDVGRMQDGRAMYHLMLNPEGGVIDDCILYRFGAEDWMLVVNAGNIQTDFDWLTRHAPSGVRLEDISGRIAKIDLQGPGAPRLISRFIAPERLAGLGFFRFIPEADVGGMEVLVSRTGYTGEVGFELYTRTDCAEELWNLLLDTGADLGILPCGLGARDSLRIEAGLPLHGHELRPDLTAIGHPWEFVFAWDREFIGKAAVRDKMESGTGPFVYAFRMQGRRKAMPGWEVRIGRRPAGRVLSGVIAPSLGNIPIGFLETDTRLEPGAVLSFRQEGRPDALAGEISPIPFVPQTCRKKMDLFL